MLKRDSTALDHLRHIASDGQSHAAQRQAAVVFEHLQGECGLTITV
jgi:hypothetical protein